MKSDFSAMPAVLAKLRKAVDEGVKRAATDLVNITHKAVDRGAGQRVFAHAAAGTPPFNKTGNLKRNIGQTPVVKGYCRVVSRARYSHIQEYGGTIRPKKGKRLPVPLNWEAQRMQQRLGAGGSLKSYKLRLIPASKPGGNPYLVKVVGKKQKLVSMFVLVKKVTIKPHPFMRPSLEKARPRMVAQMKGAVRAIMGSYA